ncbi:MAG: methyltransferase domain-containing protein [Pseudomonadota bacterium]
MKGMDTEVSWWEYARTYDQLCEVNHHYQKLIEHYREWLVAHSKLHNTASICDIGAGTGNFVLTTADVLPSSELHHFDWNSEMTSIAERKYEKRGLNVEIHKESVERLPSLGNSFDLIIMINALYSFKNPKKVLEDCRHKLKPGGYIYVVDTGRPIQTHRFSADILSKVYKSRGLLGTLSLYRQLLPAVKANRQIEKTASNGEYWRHSTKEFEEAFNEAGFTIAHSETCYRGIADRVIGQREFDEPMLTTWEARLDQSLAPN